MDGKAFRLRRLSRNNKYLIVPMDHGITTSSIGQLFCFPQTVERIINSDVSAIIVHKGMVRYLPPLKDVGLIIHLSASTNYCCEVRKQLVCSVEEAVSLGADGVSIHVNIGNDYEKEMLKDFSTISQECKKYQIPLLVMMYLRDNFNKDISTPLGVKHAIRIATELGADIVKISVRWDSDTLSEIASDALIPVVIAGGELKEKDAFLTQTEHYMQSGIAGICYGRNIFLSNEIETLIPALKEIVFGSLIKR